jgi:DNA-binding Xre family transcriptional regulator
MRFIMVRLRIQEIAQERGITTAYQLQKLMEVPPMTASRLWKGEMEMVALKTIDALCEALSCEPGDLFTREGQITKPSKSKKR